ncbi:hypothetical protein Tco_0248117 [Tanacetum coccineum]
MVSVTIQQDTSIIPPMTSPVIDLVTRPDSPNVHWPLPTTTTTTAAPPPPTTTTTLPLPPQPQQGSSDSILIKRMGELEQHIADLVEENQALEKRLDKQGNRIHKLETMDWPKMIREQTVEFIESQEIDRKIEESVKEVVISSVKHAMRAPLRARFKDLPTSDMKEILLQRISEGNKEESSKISPNTPPRSPPSPPPPPPPPSGASGASGTTGASDSAQAPPPPPPSSSTHQGGQSTSTAAPSSSKIAALAEYTAWITTDTQIKSLVTTIPDDLYMDDETTADEQAYSSGDEVGRDHIPTVNLRQSWWKPLTEDRPATPEPAWTIPSSDLSMPTNNWASALKSTYVPPQENSLLAQTGDMATFMDWYCKQQGISELTPKDLEGPAFEIVKVFHHDVIHLQFQMEECHKLLTGSKRGGLWMMQSSGNNVSQATSGLGSEPAINHVKNRTSSSNKDLEYLRGRKVGRPALSISKMKAAYYPDVGLEQLVPDQFWIEEECKRPTSSKDSYAYLKCRSNRSLFNDCTNNMKKNILRRADLKEYVIAERDFKHMYPSDFEDLYLLNLQGHLNHLSPEDKKILTTAVNLWTRNLVIRHRVEDFQLGIESYQTQLNLTKPRWEATGFEFKHDYTVIDSPRAVTFRDRYGVQMIMRTNPGMNTRFWTKKDVTGKQGLLVPIQKWLRHYVTFGILESVYGGADSEKATTRDERTE